MNANDRVNSPISTAELERRWAAVRAAKGGFGRRFKAANKTLYEFVLK